MTRKRGEIVPNTDLQIQLSGELLREMTQPRKSKNQHSTRVVHSPDIPWLEIIMKQDNTYPSKPPSSSLGNDHYELQHDNDDLVKQTHWISIPLSVQRMPEARQCEAPWGFGCREALSLFTLNFVFMQCKQSPNSWFDPLPRELMAEDSHFQGWQQSPKMSRRAKEY